MATRKRSTQVNPRVASKPRNPGVTMAQRLFPLHALVIRNLAIHRDPARAQRILTEFTSDATGAQLVDFDLAADAIDAYAMGLDHGLGV